MMDHEGISLLDSFNSLGDFFKEPIPLLDSFKEPIRCCSALGAAMPAPLRRAARLARAAKLMRRSFSGRWNPRRA